MSALPIIVPVIAEETHFVRCLIELSTCSGWDVRVEVDNAVVSEVHCSDWHRVERVCTAIRLRYQPAA